MPKVIAFGTFDGLHPGHRFYLDSAAKYGDLVVIVARDSTVQAVKGKTPMRSEETRLRSLIEAGYRAVLGSLGDKYAVLRTFRPDVICLGYDQQAFTEGLERECQKLELDAKIVRVPALEPERYKSSLLNR